MRWVASLALGCLWLPCVAPLMDLERPGDQELGQGLRLALVEGGSLERAEVGTAEEAARNPEWDLMANLYVVLALSNMASHPLAVPEGQRSAQEAAEDARVLLSQIDSAIEATLAVEAREGQFGLLLPYARAGSFRDPSARSLFVDGEIAMMLAARLQVAPDPRMRALLAARVRVIEAQMARGPVLSAESYPDECWTFCNTTALAALRAADPLLGTDHRAQTAAWVAMAKEQLLDDETGLLVSSYTWEGRTLDGPEGSTIWMVAHNLRSLDPAFARDQYTRARASFGVSALGMGWAREWPVGADSRQDVDSGVVVPLLGASPGASGLALLGAASFGDSAYSTSLRRSLELAGARQQAAAPGGEEIYYGAAGRIGNAVLLYALSLERLSPVGLEEAAS